MDAATAATLPHVWTIGDDITTHPLWEQQVELEYGMMRTGANKLRDAVAIAERDGKMQDLRVVKGLVKDWLPGIADSIKQWVKDMDRSKGGPKPIALAYVRELDPYVSALIALRAVMGALGGQHLGLTYLANQIGANIEYEQRVRLWEQQCPELFHHHKNKMDRQGSTAVHRRRVNINRFNVYLKEDTFEGKVKWTPWTNDVVFRVGWCLMDCIIRKTQWFEVMQDPTHVFKKGKVKSPKLILAPKPELMEWFAKSLDASELMQAEFAPTIIPPKRWEGTREGGYWTPYVRPPRLIRFKAHQEHQKQRAADEYDSLAFPKVYTALNLLQETAWRVNRRVLAVLREGWGRRHWEEANLPAQTPRELPARTARHDEWRQYEKECRARHQLPAEPEADLKEEMWQWRKRASVVHAFNNKLLSHKRSTEEIFKLATKYEDYDAFYYPHMLDFRGRMYPIPAYLQPQGNDLARGLLSFSKGIAVTKANGGVRWLAIQLASMWGKDKWSYDARVKWVEENEVMFRLIAEDPYGNKEWCDADEPWQALAATFEWVDYLNHGEGFVSHLPVMVDGTCNGIQHLSAITRDEVAGAYVNLVPSSEPQDIYKFVARELQDILEGLNTEDARWWIDLCDGELPRSLTKRQVMVLPYGGTKDSFFGYTRAWLDEKVPVTGDESEAEQEERTRRIIFLTNHLWATVNRCVSGAMAVMQWLKETARVVTADDQPIYWKVPSGFVVRHFYGLDREFRAECMLDGERVQLKLREKTAKLSIREQLQGISPNFIHSLDASALVDCLCVCAEDELVAFASVHDAYGTHAANMDYLAPTLREAFVRTHETDVLGSFRAACASVIIPTLIVQKGMDPLEAAQKAEEMLRDAAKPLTIGNLDLNSVLGSDYFFA